MPALLEKGSGFKGSGGSGFQFKEDCEAINLKPLNLEPNKPLNLSNYVYFTSIMRSTSPAFSAWLAIAPNV